MKNTRTVQLITIASVLFICVLFGAFWRSRPERARDQQAGGRESLRQPLPTRSLYTVQTESCLPDHLSSAEALGNASACQCDVLVLSYKTECIRNAPTSSHIEYLFVPSITWTAGRNLLYQVAWRRSERYLYYIFMDDDIHLEVKSNTTKTNPWRLFEDFLRRVEPAVGVVDGSGRQCLPVVYKARKSLGCVLDDEVECVPTPRFDAAFNAFHYKAAKYLLPYTVNFDAISWWYPVVYMEIKSEVIFQGHVVIHTNLIAINKRHRPYKRKAPSKSDIVNMADEIEAGLPKKFQHVDVLQEWRKDGVQHERRSSTTCLPPPYPHMPVIPFRTLRTKQNA